MSADRETLAAYAARVEDYARMAEDQADDPLLATFIAALPAGARVLDLGCGPGRAAERMAAAGLTVEATDAAPEMVERAARIPGVMARVATFDDITGSDHFDGIWANFSLLHAPRADMPRLLPALHRALRPGGRFHIGMKTGTGVHRDSLGRLYTYYTADELNALLAEAGFTPLSSQTGCDTGLGGTPEDRIAITAHG